MTRHVKWLPGCLSLLLMAVMLLCNPIMAGAAIGFHPIAATAAAGRAPGLLPVSNTPEVVDTTKYNYAFRVATGSNSGDYIGGFFIRYIDGNGNACSEFLDPHDGSLGESVAAANAAQQKRGSSKKIQYLNRLGYDIDAFNNQKDMAALSSNSTNTFLLSLEGTISSVQSIDILTDIGVSGRTKNWSCVSMELFEVKELRGFDMSGYYSQDYHIDFDGKLLAKTQLTPGASSYLIKNPKDSADGLISISEKHEGSMWLVSGEALGAAAMGEFQEMYVELALADVAGAGIDAFVNPVDSKAPVSGMYLPECLILKANYYDTFDNARTISVPVITSALAYAMERGDINESTTLAEFLGQGQNLILKLKVYDFKSFMGGNNVDFELIYDPKNAASMVGFRERTEAKSSHETLAENMVRRGDDISILGMYLYQNAEEASFAYEVENNCILKLRDDRSARTGSLTKFVRANTPEGISQPVSETGATRKYTLKPYTQGAALEPQDTADKYLVRIHTFPAEEAATSSSISLKLKYTGNDNEEHESAAISLEDAARAYYGSWPGSGGVEFGYRYGLSADQTLSCIISLDDVQKFNAATLNLKGEDTWQFDHIEIIKVNEQGIGGRHVIWLESSLSVGNLHTDRRVYRDIEGQAMPLGAVVASFDGDVFMNQNASSKTVDFEKQSADVTEDTLEHWREDYYSSMPYEVTQQNLGFTQSRVNYDITVVVGSDELATSNGDCGSSNFFYFQLEFENGKSAYVQANQQLASDAFLEGTEACFSVSTNYDYGQLTAINVIPDDSSSDANPYDKLKIDSIRVRRYDQDVEGRLYEWEMFTTEENCWVGIDYREEAEDNSAIAKSTRDVESYKTTYTSFEYRSISQVLVAINTTTYDGDQLIATDMSAVFQGTRLDGTQFTVEVGDVLKRMYDFYGQAPKLEGGKTISDPATMFRVGVWNYFLIGLENVKNIDSMTLSYRGKEIGDWNIERVELYRVTRNRGIKIAEGNYYCLDGEMEQVTQSENTTPIRSEIISLDQPATVSISFLEQGKPLEEASTEDYRVSRTPASRNDYVNIALYMDQEYTDDYDKYTVTGAVEYFANADVRMSSSNIHFNTRQVGNETVFYASGIGVRDICSVNKLVLQAEYAGGGTGLCTVHHAVVQRIRGGVIVETYWFNCMTNIAISRFSFDPSAGTVATGDYQMVSLSLGEGTTDLSGKGLTSEQEDVAVAIQYRSSIGDTTTVYQSPYVFLTDQQITSIRNHSVCHLKFTENYVREITGIAVAATGKTLQAAVEAASVTTYTADPANPTWESLPRMSFKTDGYGCNAAYVVNGKNTLVKAGTKSFAAKSVEIGSQDAVYPVSMVFTTGEGQRHSVGDIGVAEAKIPMEINYRSEDGEDYIYNIPDIKEYLVSGGFGPGETAEIQFLAQDMSDINYIVIKVQDDDESTFLRWDLRQVDFSFGDAADQKDYSVSVPEDTCVMEDIISDSGTDIVYTAGSLKLGVRPTTVVLTASTSNNAGGVTSIETTSDPAGAIPEIYIMDSTGIVTMKVDIRGKNVKKSVTVHAGINSPDDSKGYISLDPNTGVITFKVPTDQPARYTVRVEAEDNPQAAAVIYVIVQQRLTVSDTSGGGTSGGGTSGGGTSGGGTSGDDTSGGGTSGGDTSGGGTSGDDTSGGGTSGDDASGGGTSGDDTSGGGTSGDDTSGGTGEGGGT